MGWTTKDMREDLKELRKMYHQEKDSDKKEEILKDINTLIGNIVDYELVLDDVTQNAEDGPLELFAAAPMYARYFPTVYKFINLVESLPYDYYLDTEVSYDPLASISKRDLFDILHEFFNSCGTKVAKYYNELEKENDKYLIFDNERLSCSGNTYVVPRLGHRYIWIGTDGNPKNIPITMAHEYGHCIASKMYEHRYSDEKLFHEIESTFFELLCEDYMYNEMNDPFYKKCLEEDVSAYYWSAKTATLYKRTFDYVFNNMSDDDSAKKYFNRYAKKHYGNTMIGDKKIVIDLDSAMNYLFGYLCAVELFEIYKEDKELAIDLLEKIVAKSDNEYESIYGNITPVKSMKKHINRFKGKNYVE